VTDILNDQKRFGIAMATLTHVSSMLLQHLGRRKIR
jgi:hypothetical protein